MPTATADSLFSITRFTAVDDRTSEAHVGIDHAHSIFNGHFPGKPFLPGVIMVRIVKAIAERMTGGPLEMVSARSIKFLAPVDPTVTAELIFKTSAIKNEDGSVRINSEGSASGTIVMKLVAEFKQLR